MVEWTYLLQVLWHLLIVLALIFALLFSGVLYLASRPAVGPGRHGGSR